MVLLAVLRSVYGNSKASINHNRNGGTNCNISSHQHHHPRKSRTNASISWLCKFGIRVLLPLFIIGMLSTMLYTHYILLNHSDYTFSYSHGQHPFLLLSKLTTTNSYDTQQQLICPREYQRIMSHVITNLTVDDYDRSIAHVGNRYRLSRIIQQKLLVNATSTSHDQPRQPLTIVVCGGSITLGHGITPVTSRYSNQLELYLNDIYPTKPPTYHKVYNRGAHGADVRTLNSNRTNEKHFLTLSLKNAS